MMEEYIENPEKLSELRLDQEAKERKVLDIEEPEREYMPYGCHAGYQEYTISWDGRLCLVLCLAPVIQNLLKKVLSRHGKDSTLLYQNQYCRSSAGNAVYSSFAVSALPADIVKREM